MIEHPSFLQLDRHALGANLPGVAEHISSCEVCAKYVESLAPRAEAPAWAIGSTARPRRWWPAALAASILAAALYFGTGYPPPYVGLKGAPNVFVYVKRGEEIARWSGAAIRAGDALRLGVDGAGFDHVAVLAGEEKQLVHRGPLERGEVLLPFSLVVDEFGDLESITVVLGKRPLADDELSRAGDDLQRIELRLEKERP